jgi:uncharacterized protein YecE (DUF72 family)
MARSRRTPTQLILPNAARGFSTTEVRSGGAALERSAAQDDVFVVVWTKGILEPRHTRCFTPSAEPLLHKYGVARAAADPPKGAPEAAEPGGSSSLIYYRLHGSSRTYYSNYEDRFLRDLTARIQSVENAWVIFDNTALSHAYSNALRLEALITEA